MTTATHQAYGRRVFWYFVLFFVTLIAVDVTMATVAIRTQTGVVTEHPYETGVAYNKVVAAYKEQEALGWKGDVSFKAGVFSFSLKDSANHPVIAEKVTAQFSRPTQSGMDFSATFAANGNGEYSVSPSFPAKGVWDVRLFATQGDKHYQHPQRIVVE